MTEARDERDRDVRNEETGGTGRGRRDADRQRPDKPDESVGAGPETSSMGKGDSAAVAGSDEQQPEIAEGPEEGLEPGEEVQRGPWHPPLEVDPPSDNAIPRDAAGEPEAVREQEEEGGP